jgi:hypothetical protein
VIAHHLERRCSAGKHDRGLAMLVELKLALGVEALSGCPHAELGFERVIQTSYRDACHSSMTALLSLMR